MARANSRDMTIRHALEAIGVELAVVKMEMPMVRLRIEQARSRTGLNELLSPALANAAEVVKALDEAERQVRVALDAVALSQCRQ